MQKFITYIGKRFTRCTTVDKCMSPYTINNKAPTWKQRSGLCDKSHTALSVENYSSGHDTRTDDNTASDYVLYEQVTTSCMYVANLEQV